MEAQCRDLIQKRLEETWLSRWNQDIESAMQGLADIQAAVGWNDWAPEAISGMSRDERTLYTDALLLKASLLRAQGQRRQSSSLIRKIMMAQDAVGEPRGFRLLFELGIDHWIEHDVAGALDNFFLAERKSRLPEEKAYTLTNVLLCLEALDLERTETEAKFKAALEAVGSETRVKQATEQWQAYKLRKNFFQQLEIPEKKSYSGQAGFFAKWVRALPYAGKERAETEGNGAYLWSGAYRLRTLSGIWVPADRHHPSAGDIIDRLYLWTWMWMANAPEIAREKIYFTVESLMHGLEVEMQGKENLLLLRNCLEWIALLEPSLSKSFQKVMNSLRRIQGSRYPVLEAEYYLIQRLSPHSSDNTDLDRLIERFPMFAKIARETLAKNSVAPTLPLLRERLTPFLGADQGGKLMVDMLRGNVRLPGREETIHSPGLSRLIMALEGAKRVPFHALISEDADPRSVHNFVARLRKLTGKQSVSIRGEEVLRGTDWPGAVIVHGEAAAQPETLAPVVSLKQEAFVSSDAHFTAARALLTQNFTRKDLEKNLRVSKATACRMIDNWLKNGKLDSQGKAKATVYRWTPEENI